MKFTIITKGKTEVADTNMGITYKDIKTNYKRLMMIFHPDMHKYYGIMEGEKQEANKIYNLIRDVYDYSIEKKEQINAKETDICEEFEEAHNIYDYSEQGDKSEFSFEYGTIKRNYNIEKPKKIKISYKNKKGEQKTVELFEFCYTDLYGETHTIYSEHSFEELFKKREFILTSKNLQRALSYDVQDEQSQYGYVGNKDIGLKIKLNKNVLKYLRNIQIEHTQTLIFNKGNLNKKLDENGKQTQIYSSLGIIYEYEYMLNGKKVTIWTTSTFEELSKPTVKKLVETKLLSEEKLAEVLNYDVQDSNSKFGYVGKIVYDRMKGEYTYFSNDDNIIKILRDRHLKSISELKFKGGSLKKLLDNNTKKQSVIEKNGIVVAYGYIYTDVDGKIYNVYCNNSFFELSFPNCKHVIENALLSQDNLQRALDYEKKYGFGYIGKIRKDSLNNQYIVIHDDITHIISLNNIGSEEKMDDPLMKALENGYKFPRWGDFFK